MGRLMQKKKFFGSDHRYPNPSQNSPISPDYCVNIELSKIGKR
jgi:hypothetical protein